MQITVVVSEIENLCLAVTKFVESLEISQNRRADLDSFLHALETCDELGARARLLRQTVNQLRQFRLRHNTFVHTYVK